MSDTLRCKHDLTGVCGECRESFLPYTPEEHRADFHHHAQGLEDCDQIPGGCPIIIAPWSPSGQGGM